MPAFVVILLVCFPVAASTSKIAAGAPVFIGETNLDITSAIGDCHVIAWWPEGADTSTPPAINLTVKGLNQANGMVTHFNVSPQFFMGHTGSWYCQDKAPFQEVLYVLDPQFTIRVWNLDNDTDISGQAVPATTNVTYRIDTNLNQYADYYNRTKLNPSDTVFTVTMTDPLGRGVTNLYTGSAGASSTVIMKFDTSPFITTPVYYGRNLGSWNHLSRDAQGALLYPPGTYTITASQNLGNMQQAYADAGITDQTGRTTATTSVTFLAYSPVSPAATTQQPVSPVVSLTTTPAGTEGVTTIPAAQPATTQPVPTKTPYQPLPWWVTVMATGIAGLLVMKRVH